MRRRLLSSALLLAAGLAAVPAQAQTAAQARADSARMRILGRIERLGRPLGSDSVLFIQDSIAQEEARGMRGGGRAGPDSTLSALLGMKGFALTEYEGGSADFSAKDRVLVLHAEEGKRARVNREGMEVQADTSITYSEAQGRVRTVGGSTFTPPEGDPVESRGLVYDLEAGVGSASGARTSYSQSGSKWLVRGDMPLAAQDSMFMSHAIFTSCDLEVPHYHFQTDEIKIIGGRVMVARPVRLYFADVPVFWLPFIAQSTSQGRSSGLLTPRFSVNDIVRNSTGYRRRLSNLGFYWAMSDYSDAIVALDWFSDNFLSMTGSMNYRFNRQFLDGSLNYRHYWSADGSVQRAIDTQHSWEIDERTSVRISGRYASSADFIRQNSFNPAEVTQSIDSEGGANRRFGWGSLSLSANRRQYMSDDRIEWTLPTANLSLSTITLFRAPQNRAKPWNNMTMGGSASMSRSTIDRAQGEVFDRRNLDTENTTASASSSLSLGRFSVSQSVNLKQASVLDIPEAYLILGDSASPGDLITGAPARSITDQTLGWRASLDFQQPLIGSTTLTPSFSISGDLLQSDTIDAASSFVSGPRRISFGANLKTDLYRFYPGFGGYERLRHKFSPSFAYDWSPSVEPTTLQRDVFGSRALRRRNGLSININNTFEAKKARTDTAAADTAASAQQTTAGGAPGEPRKQERAEIVQLLGIRTSVIQYDFVDADSLGSFLWGFQSTRLSNAISSDMLQGLQLQMDHELFEDTKAEDGSVDRAFKPHLAQVNLGFSLSNRSSLFRLFGLLGGGGDELAEEEATQDETQGEGLTTPSVDESSIIPGSDPAARQPGSGRPRQAGDRSWQANLSYALQRPRNPDALASQMLNASVNLHPTDQWDLSWRTSYDLERGAFNDHSIRLTRNLHRWEANFDFLQTATGNWQFRFEVSLTDNQDLKFDYQQRNLDAGRRPSTRY